MAFDPTNEVQWLYKATRFTFAKVDHRNCREVKDYPAHIEACEQRDGSVKWAVRRMGQCLGGDGSWDFEALPSSRTDEWLGVYRFESKEQAYAALLRDEKAA